MLNLLRIRYLKIKGRDHDVCISDNLIIFLPNFKNAERAIENVITFVIHELTEPKKSLITLATPNVVGILCLTGSGLGNRPVSRDEVGKCWYDNGPRYRSFNNLRPKLGSNHARLTVWADLMVETVTQEGSVTTRGIVWDPRHSFLLLTTLPTSPTATVTESF